MKYFLSEETGAQVGLIKGLRAQSSFPIRTQNHFMVDGERSRRPSGLALCLQMGKPRLRGWGTAQGPEWVVRKPGTEAASPLPSSMIKSHSTLWFLNSQRTMTSFSPNENNLSKIALAFDTYYAPYVFFSFLSNYPTIRSPGVSYSSQFLVTER